jgi:hypothetical protein
MPLTRANLDLQSANAAVARLGRAGSKFRIGTILSRVSRRGLRSITGIGLKTLGVFLGLCIRALSQTAAIPDAEVLLPPTPSRVTAIHAAAQRDGWAPQVGMLRATAMRAYEKEKMPAAEAWLNVFRWAALFGQREGDFVSRWMEAVQAAKVGHTNMARNYDLRARSLGAAMSPELQAWVLGNGAFSAEFFAVLSSVDYLPRAFEILSELYRRDPVRLKSHASLALAIAIVFDIPPPPFWPHLQVTEAALPRQFPPPAEAFAWWVKQEQLGKTYHKLSRLGAAELKFVVDAAAPLAELEWSQQHVHHPLNQLASAYTMIRYRKERAAANAAVWPGRTYALAEILATGGICSDQAYFATEVGKARGVPTLFIYGAGNDGRHAWFGFLDGNQKWQLDAGRYAEQRFVTGFALDPQTWGQFSDHELQFLSERFRELPSFRQSRLHATFAEVYLATGNGPAAGAAARKAVNFERRNQAGWDALVAAARKEGRDDRTIENILREAVIAFRLHPDVEAHYVNRVAESLRARGQTSAAEEEVRRIARVNKTGRTDLSVKQASEILQRAIATQPLAEQIRSYNSVVDSYGAGAGVGFFDAIVVPFVEHMIELNQRAEATRAIERARHVLKVEPGSQLAQEFERLAQSIKAAK